MCEGGQYKWPFQGNNALNITNCAHDMKLLCMERSTVELALGDLVIGRPPLHSQPLFVAQYSFIYILHSFARPPLKTQSRTTIKGIVNLLWETTFSGITDAKPNNCYLTDRTRVFLKLKLIISLKITR